MKLTLDDLEQLRCNNPIVARAINCRRNFQDDQSMLIALVKALVDQNEHLLAQLTAAAQNAKSITVKGGS